MAGEGNEPHFETDAARGASSPNIVRWILLVSLFAVIVLLSIIWITGAATHSGEDADELEAADPAADVAHPTVENQAAGEDASATGNQESE